MQKLLLEGDKNLDRYDLCVPTPAYPMFSFFLAAVRSQTPFPSDLAFARLLRRHVRRAVCPSAASTRQVLAPPAVPNPKKKTGHPLAAVGIGMGTGTLVGLPSGPPDPSLDLPAQV